MANTRNALNAAIQNVDESMGQRRVDRAAKLSPVASAKDVGRMPLRTFGKADITKVIPDPEQPRREFDEQEIQRLAETIRSHGLLHPIRVRWDEFLEKWIIVSGERRWRATRKAGLSTIDCYFIDGEVSEPELREQQLIENLQRKDLNPLEEAKAYQSLMDLNSWNGKQVAEALCITPSRVSRALAMLDLPVEVQEQVAAGTIAKTSAYEISKLDDPHKQATIADKAASGELPHAKAVDHINQHRRKKTTKPRAGLNLAFDSDTGVRVTVTAKSKSNYHEVEQALADALDEVQHRIRNNISLF